MKKMLAVAIFTLATLSWAAAQQPGSTPGGRSGGQTTAPGSQAPDVDRPMPPDQGAPQAGSQAGNMGQATNAPVTTGCLAGTSPNYTITDTAGKSYKLNLPAGADPNVLTSHVGEQVSVVGDVRSAGGTNSIDVSRMSKGTGKCPGSPNGTTGTSSGTQEPPRQ